MSGWLTRVERLLDQTVKDLTEPFPTTFDELMNYDVLTFRRQSSLANQRLNMPRNKVSTSGNLPDDQDPVTLSRSPSMATQIYKLVFNFIESSGATWSEVFYRVADSAQTAVVVNTAAINARLRMMHPTALLRNIRANNVAGGRDSFTANQNYPGTFVDGTGAGPAPAGTAAVASFAVTTGRSVLHWMRGLPTLMVVENPNTGFPNPPANLISAIRSFATQMGASGCGSRTLTASPKFQIQSVTPQPLTGTALITYTVGAGQTPPVFTVTAPNNRIVIGQASKKDFPSLNGHWTIVGTTTPTGNPLVGTVTIRYVVANVPATSVSPIACNAYLKSEAYGSVNLFTGASLAYYGTHSTRSVFSNSRGAKHANRLRVLA